MTVNEATGLIKTDIINRDKGITRWADLGCGDGLFTIALGSMLTPGSVVYGIDKNVSLKPGLTNNGIKIIPIELDFVNEDPGLRNLDGILMANSLHYVKDKPALISKMETFLQAAAFFLIVEYDTDIPVPRWVPYPVSFLSLSKLFKDAGYTDVRKLNERPSAYRRGNMYSALARR